MNYRALLRRAFPYVVVGIGGFALAYVITFVFFIPSKIVPPAQHPYVPDSSRILRPIDTSLATPETAMAPLPTTVPMAVPKPPPPPLIAAPDLVGMTLPDARGILNTLRLRTVVLRDTNSFQPPNTVLRQSPEAGNKLLPDSTITLTVSYFPPRNPADTMPMRPPPGSSSNPHP